MANYEKTISKIYKWRVDLLMILVTLGTQDKPFDRLLEAIDKEIKKKNIKEKVIVQAGYTKYESANMEIFDLISQEDLDRLIDESSLIITHGGVGSILSAIKKGKKIIVAPRLSKYKEHTNDHQKQIVKEFSNRGYILELKDFNKLGKMIEKSKTFKPKKFVSNTNNMINLIDNYIEEDNHISWYNKLKEIIWYGFFGVLTTIINIISFSLLDKIGLNLYLSNFLAWLISVLFAFITNKLLVFNSKSLKASVFIKEMASFFFFRILSLGIDMLGMYIMIKLLTVNKLISKIIVNIIVIIANYIFSKLFIFKKEKKL